MDVLRSNTFDKKNLKFTKPLRNKQGGSVVYVEYRHQSDKKFTGPLRVQFSRSLSGVSRKGAMLFKLKQGSADFGFVEHFEDLVSRKFEGTFRSSINKSNELSLRIPRDENGRFLPVMYGSEKNDDGQYCTIDYNESNLSQLVKFCRVKPIIECAGIWFRTKPTEEPATEEGTELTERTEVTEFGLTWKVLQFQVFNPAPEEITRLHGYSFVDDDESDEEVDDPEVWPDE